MNDNECRYGAILDLDGTLIDSYRVLNPAILRTANMNGAKLTIEDVKATLGMGVGKRFHHFKEQGHITSQITEQEWVEAIVASTMISANKMGPMPGALDLLDYLSKNNIPMVIFTNGERVVTDLKMGNLGNRANLIKHVITTEDVERPKPAPDGYLLAAEIMGVKPENCVVFEDSNTGVEAAKAAGMKVVFIPQHAEENIHGADLVVTSMKDRQIAAFIQQKFPAARPAPLPANAARRMA
jgi:HAD superfamily hydrolase (TIGR01509 family)